MRRLRRRAAGLLAATLLAGSALVGCGGGNGSAGSPPAEVAEPAAQSTAGSARLPADVPPDDLAPCPRVSGAAPPTGGLPDLALPCLVGDGTVELRSLGDGTPTVLNLWASWCAPCLEELPGFQQLATAAGDRVRFLGVLTRDQSGPDGWGETLAATGVSYPSVRDDDGALLAWSGSPGMPVTLLVRPDGTVAHREFGQVDDAAELSALLARHLGVRL